MTVRAVPIHSCDKPGCNAAATKRIMFDARRGAMEAYKVCEKHIGWGKARAEEIERS